MKKHLSLLFTICLSLLFSCSKNISDGIEKTDRVSQLFQQVKNDPNYIEYYKAIMKSTSVAIANGKKSVENQRLTGKSDSIILLDKNQTLEQKYKALNYEQGNYNWELNNQMKMFKLTKYMYTTYPAMNELTDEERIRFAKISRHYINGLNQ